MAEFDKLSTYIDETGLENSTRFMLEQFSKVEAGAEKMKKVLLDASNVTFATDGGIKQKIEAVTNLEKQTSSYGKTLAEIVPQVELLNSAQKKQLQTQNNSLQQNIKNLNDYKFALAANAEVQKKALADVEKEIITADQYRFKITALTEAQFKLKQQISETTKEIKLQGALNSSAPTSINQARAQNIQLTGLRNALPTTDTEGIAKLNALIDRNNQLIDVNSDKLAKQKINIGNYANSFKGALTVLETELTSINSKIKTGGLGGIEVEDLTKKQNILTNAISLATKETATATQQQKNYKEAAQQVGLAFGTNSEVFKNFSSEVKKGNGSITEINKSLDKSADSGSKAGSVFTKLYSGLRQLANIIPGLGIGGLVLLLIAPLQSLGEGIIKYFKKSINSVSELTEEAKKKAKELAAAESEINQAYINNTTGSITHLEHLREVLNDTTKSQHEREAALRAFNQVADEGNKLDETQINNLTAINDKISQQISLIERRGLTAASEGIVKDRATKLLLAQEAARTEALRKQEAEDAYNIQTAETKKTDAYFLTLQREGSIREKISKDTKVKQAKAELDAALEVARRYEFVDDPDKSKKTSAKAAKELQKLRDRQNTEFEIYKINQERKINLFDKDIASETAYYTEKLTALDNFIKATQELLQKEEENDINAKERAAQRDIQHLEEEKKGKNASQISRLNANQKIIQENLEQDILLIKAKYVDKGLDLIQTGADKRQKIIDDQLKKEEDAYKQYLETKKLLEEDPEGDKRIEEGFKKRLQQEKEFNEKRIGLQKELIKTKEDLALQGEDFLFTLATARFDRQNNLLEQQKDAADKNAQAQIEAVNASTASEEEKAARIIVINARLQAQKDALDRKEKDNNLKKAKFDQAQQIFEIGINTIKSIAAINLKAAELRAAAALNPLLLGLIPVVLGQIPFALASGALAIATVLAKPLPKFKYGLEKDYEGLGIVGDGQRSEMILRKDGTAEVTPATDTLTWINKGDRIFPDANEFLADMQKSALKDVVRKSNLKEGITEKSYGEEMAKALEKNALQIVNAINNKEQLRLGSTQGGMQALWKWGSRQAKYVDENTNW